MALAAMTAWPCVTAANAEDQNYKVCADTASAADAVIAGCSAVIASSSNDPDTLSFAYFRRGLTYYYQNKNDQALQDIDQSIGLKPAYEPAWVLRESVYENLGRHDVEFQQYDDAIRNKRMPDDGFVEALRCAAMSRWSRDIKAAEAACNEAIDGDAARKSVHYSNIIGMAVVYYREGQYDGTGNACSQALGAGFGKFSDVWYLAGLAAQKNGDRADGNKFIAVAKKIEPGIAERYARYGITP